MLRNPSTHQNEIELARHIRSMSRPLAEGDRIMSLVLVIEDVRTQRMAAVHALAGANHQVLEASNGTQGLEIARLHAPDVIVCDVVMPQMNGYQFVEALRKEAGIGNTPVVMLTAMAERAHMRIAMTAGADDYLAKPFAAQELVDAVAALLRKRQAQRQEIVASIKDRFLTALQEQKESLASQYEMRFVRELNARWDHSGAVNDELHYEHGVVLLVDLFGSILSQLPSGTQLGSTVRLSYERARDALYLYGARHLLPLGNDLLAVFVTDPESPGPRAEVQALRAAFALVKAVDQVLSPMMTPAPAVGSRGPTASLCEGAVTMLHVSDPLHGDPHSTLATGAALGTAEAQLDFARERGWRIVAPASLALDLAGLAEAGDLGSLPADGERAGLQITELRPPALMPS